MLIAAHNPHMPRLEQTLAGLENQTLAKDDWELVLVDNRSEPPLSAEKLKLSRFCRYRLIQENRLGLLYARMSGIRNATAEIVTFCDDDMVLDSEFLRTALKEFDQSATLGNLSGKITLTCESPPDGWTSEFWGLLAARDFGDERVIVANWSGRYPVEAFGGGGSCFRRRLLEEIVAGLEQNGDGAIVGRTGRSLASGEDNVFVLECLRRGWNVAYQPLLRVEHLIPSRRLERDYLAKINEAIACSWIQVLHRYGLCPWKPISRATLSLRILRSYFVHRAWRGPAEFVRWRGSCGAFRGRAAISAAGKVRHA